jgi:hypothetical protein
MERSALLVTAALVIGTLALTESFQVLPAALAAYAAAWWVAGLERQAPDSGDPR